MSQSNINKTGKVNLLYNPETVGAMPSASSVESGSIINTSYGQNVNAAVDSAGVVQPTTVGNTGTDLSYESNIPTEQDTKNNQTINEINALRQKEILNARNTYEQNRAEYGSKAAALSAMGLSGSGYSEHLNAQAYAAYRDDVQAANAKADSSIMSYREGVNNKYLELLSELEQGGGGSVEYITQLSNQLGFSEEQKKSLLNKASYNEVISGLETKTFGSAAEVNEYIKDYLVSDADDSSKNKIRDAAISVIKANGFDAKDITDNYVKSALASSTINTLSTSDYDSLKNGDDITVEIDGKSYTVESDGDTKNVEVINYASKNNLDGKIFAYGDANDLYMYKDGKVYKIVSKSKYYNEDYNAVRRYLLSEKVITEESIDQTKNEKEDSLNRTTESYYSPGVTGTQVKKW